MTGFLAQLLLDPKTLGVILTSFGGAIVWLLKNARDCRMSEAVLKVKLGHMEDRVMAAEKTINRLCTLLKRETHIG